MLYSIDNTTLLEDLTKAGYSFQILPGGIIEVNSPKSDSHGDSFTFYITPKLSNLEEYLISDDGYLAFELSINHPEFDLETVIEASCLKANIIKTLDYLTNFTQTLIEYDARLII